MNPLRLTAHALVVALGLASVGVGAPLRLSPGRAETERTAAVVDVAVATHKTIDLVVQTQVKKLQRKTRG